MATDLLDKIEDRLSWYRSVLSNEKPAKYLLCKLIGIEKNPSTMTDSQLWIEHSTLRTRFADLWREVKDSNYSGTNQQSKPFSLLDVKLELLNRILRNVPCASGDAKLIVRKERKALAA